MDLNGSVKPTAGMVQASAAFRERTCAAREAAEAVARAGTEFLADMSHEIRTPMTAVLGFTDILREELGSCSRCFSHVACAKRVRVFEAVDTIRRNGEFLLGVMDDILEFSQIEAGTLDVEHVECSVVRVVAEVQSLMKVRADAKKIPFSVEYVGSVPEMIHSDPARLKEILIRLVGEAIKFSGVGGVRLSSRLADGDPQGPVMQFDVIDSGMGIHEERIARSLQPLTQADTATARGFGVLSLGLLISRRLAEMLGGDVAVVDSQEGEGTCFRVTITTGPLDGVQMIEDPLEATYMASDTTFATGHAGQDELHDCRVLYAEDGPDNRRLVSHVLKKAGADVTVVENGKLAVDAALAPRGTGRPGFDVILMDMQMPVMGGYEATGLLRQKGYTGPIIALTAHAMAGDREKCIRAGCDDYATKPIDRRKLIASVAVHTSRAGAPARYRRPCRSPAR